MVLICFFLLTYGCFAYLLEIPTRKDEEFRDIRSIPFPPIPFRTTSEGVLDLTSNEKNKDDVKTIEYEFEEVIDISDLVKNEKGNDYII